MKEELRMKRTLLIGLMSVALVVAFAMPSISAGPEAPKDIEMKALPSMKATQAAVKFPHGKHVAAKVDCKECHHKLDKDAKNYKCASAGCHDDGAVKQGDKSFYLAYHKPASAHSCMGCHKAKAKGPVKCTDCHPKG
jgi:hypothetical protein